ncbi:MAG: PorV/PorQ family protein [Ignavibacteria bacterium]|nr:PorV/PorQ family protein [Ignavibacteria bacterium]
MNTFQKAVLLMMVAVTGMVSVADAQVTKVGTSAAKFLSIPVGARALGMGGAFVAVADDASAMFWNPAGIAQNYQAEAMFSHSQWIADINFNYGGVTSPLGDFGTLGLHFTSLSLDEMERTTIDQPDGTGEFFSVGSIEVGVSYARYLTDWFAIGANVKYINERIWNSTATGWAVDIGTLFTTPFDGLKFGASIANFGTKMQIDGDDLLTQKDISPISGNNANVNARLTTDRFDLPLTLRIGLSYEAIEDEDQQLLVNIDAMHPNDNTESVNIGAEYTLFRKIFAIRAGYKALGIRDSEEEFTFGGGINYNVAADLRLKFDYAFESFGILNNVHKFTLGVLF